MQTLTTPTAAHVPRLAATAAPGMAGLRQGTPAATGQRITATLKLLADALSPKRRIVHAGDVLYHAGEAFTHLHVLNSGFFKLISVSADGREQVVGLKFRGDWMGFDAIARASHACDAVAMDTAEVWSLGYDELLRACSRHPELMGVIHEAMSNEIMRDRDTLLSICTLPADARVVAFLQHWAHALAVRGLRADQFCLRLTPAEIGN